PGARDRGGAAALRHDPGRQRLALVRLRRLEPELRRQRSAQSRPDHRPRPRGRRHERARPHALAAARPLGCNTGAPHRRFTPRPPAPPSRRQTPSTPNRSDPITPRWLRRAHESADTTVGNAVEQRGLRVAYRYPRLPSNPTRNHFRRLLWRAGYSASAAQIHRYQKLGLGAAIRELLQPFRRNVLGGPAPPD